MSNGETSTAKPSRVILLVHGTFSPNAEWITPTSMFSTQLTELLPNTKIRSFTWTGANSHEARQAAGIILARRISAIQLKHPESLIYVIGHSHGGNAIVYALKGLTSYLNIAGAVFMATPFFHCRSRKVSNLLPVIGPMLLTALIAGVFFSKLESFFGIACLLLIPLVVLIGIKIRRRLKKWQDERDSIATDIDSSLPAVVNALIIFPVLDEARNYLQFVRGVSQLPFWAFGLFSKSTQAVLDLFNWVLQLILVAGAAGVYALILLIFIMAAAGYELLVAAYMTAWIWLMIAITFMVLMSLIPLAIRSHSLGFGKERMLMYLLLDIDVRSIPSWASPFTRTHARKYNKESLGQLRHSKLYNDEEVIRDIASWIQEIEQGNEGLIHFKLRHSSVAESHADARTDLETRSEGPWPWRK